MWRSRPANILVSKALAFPLSTPSCARTAWTPMRGDGGSDADVVHGSVLGSILGSPGLNVRHITLDAAAGRDVHDEMNVCSSTLRVPLAVRLKATKAANIAGSDVQTAGFFRFAAGRLPSCIRIEPSDPSRDLKNSLTACSVLRRGKCCARATTGAEFYRITTWPRPLARLLHCNVKSLACPIDLSADGDSRTDAVTLRHWNPDGVCGIYR